MPLFNSITLLRKGSSIHHQEISPIQWNSSPWFLLKSVPPHPSGSLRVTVQYSKSLLRSIFIAIDNCPPDPSKFQVHENGLGILRGLIVVILSIMLACLLEAHKRLHTSQTVLISSWSRSKYQRLLCGKRGRIEISLIFDQNIPHF